MKFRKDINGLRAFAVIAVVLFHFNSSWMPGGFAGVDVFFVISGFLMTGIIFRGIESDNFSILDFYIARANRIIPALALLCFVLMVFGWFYLAPTEYRMLGKHVASSVSFLSNFIYWSEADYFDTASHGKWLLHTWSLSVEWQFYIVYPLLLIALRKLLSTKTLKLLIVIGTIIGFVFSAFATYKWPSASYYLFPMRAWEMMIGGIAYLYPFNLKENKKKVAEYLGLALIIGSYFLVSADNPWPGYLAFFPVFGSFLVIQAQRNESFMTSNIVFQKLGSWSYSIYLWHWPFVVVIYTFDLSNKFIYVGLLLSVFLGFLSYKYVERIKFQKSFPSLLSYFKFKPMYIAVFTGLLGTFLYISNDKFNNYRLSEKQLVVVDQQKRNPRESECSDTTNSISNACTYGDGPVKAIVIGDSHANAQMVAIGERASQFEASILSLGKDGCATVKGLYRVDENGLNPNTKCSDFYTKSIDLINTVHKGKPVIVINRVSTYLHGKNENSAITPPEFFVDSIFQKRDADYFNNISNHMVATICEISETNPVYLMSPTPELKYDAPLKMFRSLSMSNETQTVRVSYSEHLKRQYQAISMQNKAVKECGAVILDPTPYLCDSEYCYGDIDGTPLYFDSNHLSSYGAKTIAPIYDEVFD